MPNAERVSGRDRFLMEELAKRLSRSLRFPDETTKLRDTTRGVSFDVRVFVDNEPTGHIARVTVELERLLQTGQDWPEADETGRLRALVDRLLPTARLYVSAFAEDERMTLPERLRLQEIEDILTDPDGWSPDRPIGEAALP